MFTSRKLKSFTLQKKIQFTFRLLVTCLHQSVDQQTFINYNVQKLYFFTKVCLSHFTEVVVFSNKLLCNLRNIFLDSVALLQLYMCASTF